MRLHRVIAAKADKVYRAFLDADAMAKWLAPHGFTARVDYEYERNGTANLFVLFAPLEGHVKITDRHTAIDYAHILKDLADIHFPRAKTIELALAQPVSFHICCAVFLRTRECRTTGAQRDTLRAPGDAQ